MCCAADSTKQGERWCGCDALRQLLLLLLLRA
jgi:hypothetical protein